MDWALAIENQWIFNKVDGIFIYRNWGMPREGPHKHTHTSFGDNDVVLFDVIEAYNNRPMCVLIAWVLLEQKLTRGNQ